jgi:YggT family protein
VGLFLRNLVEIALAAGTLLVLGSVVISWVEPMGRTQLAGFIIANTEPILAPVRRILPSTGMIDLSPLIVLIVLTTLLRLF